MEITDDALAGLMVSRGLFSADMAVRYINTLCESEKAALLSRLAGTSIARQAA